MLRQHHLDKGMLDHLVGVIFTSTGNDDASAVSIESTTDGQPWLELYTSGHFGNCLNLPFDLDHECGHGDLWVRYENHSAQLRSAAASLSALASTLADSLSGFVRSHWILRRDVKPAAAAHNLWFWKWKEAGRCQLTTRWNRGARGVDDDGRRAVQCER